MNASPHPIPVPESPFDGFVEMGVKALTFTVETGRLLAAKYPYTAIGATWVTLGLLILVVFLRRGKTEKREKPAEKKSDQKSSTKPTATKDSKKKKAT